MKKSIFIAILFFFNFANLALAQDNSTLAQDAYMKAEAYSLQNDNTNALKQLANAEKYLGATNSKILYLKINILKSQFSTNSDTYQELKSAIAEFFAITNKADYPSEKYLEMVRVKSDLNEFIENDSIESNRLINNGTLEDIENYVNANPNTLFLAQLNQKEQSINNQLMAPMLKELAAKSKPVPSGITASQVIENYLEAIGGRKNLSLIIDLTMKWNYWAAYLQYQKAPDKMVLIKQGFQVEIFDGKRGKYYDIEMKDDMLEKIKYNSILNLELNYDKYGIKMELGGIQKIDGKDAYIMVVQYPGVTTS